MRRRLTTALFMALLAPAALLLAGCFGVETSYVVNDDGSATQTLRLALPAELATSFGEELPTVEELEQEPEMEPLREALGDDGSISFFSSQEEGLGFVITLSVDASEDVGAALAAKAETLADAVPDEDMGSMLQMSGAPPTIRLENDEWIFEQTGQAIDPAMLGEMAGGDEAAGFATMFMEQTTITTRVKLPGEVVEHNADEELEDGTLVWRQTGADAPRTLMARSDVGGGGLPTAVLAALLIGGIAVVAGIGGYMLFGRRRSAV